MIWFLYYLLSIVITFFLIKMINNIYAKIIVFSFFISIFSSIWFVNPGESSLAPIMTIFILENSILENNGLERIFRPFIATFLITLVGSFLYFKKFKN